MKKIGWWIAVVVIATVLAATAYWSDSLFAHPNTEDVLCLYIEYNYATESWGEWAVRHGPC